jgi:hypothetical protein
MDTVLLILLGNSFRSFSFFGAFLLPWLLIYLSRLDHITD